MAEPTVIPFQGTERRPIIGLRSVPPSPENGLPYPGEGWVTVTICLFEGKAVFTQAFWCLPLAASGTGKWGQRLCSTDFRLPQVVF